MQETSLENLSFEEALAQLEQIVYQLESGKVKLQEAVSAYEKGTRLKNICEEKLKTAKSKIDLLVLNNNTPVDTDNFNAPTD